MSTRPIITDIDTVLRLRGFWRHKATWNRRFDSFVDVIALEKSKSNEAVTISAGVFHPEIHRKCWETQLPAAIPEPDCIVRARIGELIDDKDLWWKLNDARLPIDVTEKIVAYVLPFLERMHSLEAMEQFLSSPQAMKQRYPPPIIYLAILKSERGDKAGACALLAEFGKKTIGAWRPRISEIAEQLGCS